MRFSLLVVLFAGLAQAQQGRISGPVSGWVFDPGARAVRPLQGVPGAAVLGSALDLGMPLTAASVSPALDSAIATASDASVHFFRIADGVWTERILRGPAPAAETVVFSPAGRAAALIAGGTATIINGLPDAPSVAATLQIGGAFGRAPGAPAARHVAAALSDDGNYLVATSGGAATLFSTSGEKRQLARSASAAAFAPGSHDAVLGGASGVVLIWDVSGASVRTVLANAQAPETSGVAFSADGRRVFTAASGGISVFDRAGNRAAVACDCTPSRLLPMGKLLRLNEPGEGPLWLLDTSSPEAQVVFVPALSAN